MRTNTAETVAQASGVAPTISDTYVDASDPWAGIDTITGILEYTNVAVAHGGLAYRYASHGTSLTSRMRHTNASTGTSWFGRFYLMHDDAITSSSTLALFRINGGGQLAFLYLEAGGLRIRNGNDTTIALTPSVALTAGSWYRVEWNAVATSITAGTLQYRLYAGDSSTLLEDSGAQAVAWSGASTSWDTVFYGQGAKTNAPSATGYVYLDDMDAFEADWPGPSLVTVPVLESAKDFVSASRFGPF